MKNIKEFEWVVENYKNLVFKICLDLLKDYFEAENVSQETFISFYKTYDRYSNLEDNELKNLIARIALNKCRDYIKKKTINVVSIDEYIDKDCFIDAKTNIEDDFIKNEDMKILSDKINLLDDTYKLVLTEYYINSLSLDEISLKYNIKKATLKVQISRGKQGLKKLLLNLSNNEGGNWVWSIKSH